LAGKEKIIQPRL